MKLPTEPTRWRDIPARDSRPGDPVAERAGMLVRNVDEPPLLSERALSRIRQALPAGRITRRAGGIAGFVGLRPGFVAVVVLASAATAGGTGVLWRTYARRETPVAAPPIAGATSRAERHAGGIAQPRPLSPPPAGDVFFGPAPSPEPPAALVPSPAVDHPSSTPPSTPQRSRAPVRATQAPVTARADQANGPSNETEAHLLSQSLGKLRRERDPRGAVLMLDRYDVLFPHGLLGAEARRVRLEALVYAGNHRAALALLEDPRGFGEPFALDLRLLRAEFRAEAARCDQALADFSHVIDQTPSSESVERALYGRAVCWGKTGQDQRARADLTIYRSRFPHGKFSSEVERLLDRSRAGDSP